MIQSLLTQAEYDKLSRKYNTYNRVKRQTAREIRIIKIGDNEYSCGPPPNYIMGDPLTPKEVGVINNRIEAVLKAAGLIL